MDASEFEQSYSLQFARVCRIVRRRGVPASWVEDVAHDVFSKAWQNWHAFDGRDLAAWIAKIAENAAKDWLRRKINRDPPRPSEQVDPTARDGSPLDQLLDQELRQALAECREQLTADEKSVVGGKITGSSSEEIGREIGRSAADVNKIYFRAKPKLRDCMQGKGVAVDEEIRP